MNRCREVKNLLALRPADLSFEEQHQVQIHLAACADCTALVQVYVEQDRLIGHAPRVRLAPSQRSHLLAQIQRERRRYTMVTKLSVIFSSVITIVVLAALGLGVGTLVTTGRPTPAMLPTQPPARAETPLVTAKGTPAQLSVDVENLLVTPKITPTLIWPVDGHITQGYSDEHPALDIATKEGTPVIAAAAGVVVVAARDEVYGYYVIIDHGNGLRTFYSKLLDYQVEPGDEVTQGQQIGRVGSTGSSTGPHLHFEVRQNINPLSLLP